MQRESEIRAIVVVRAAALLLAVMLIEKRGRDRGMRKRKERVEGWVPGACCTGRRDTILIYQSATYLYESPLFVGTIQSLFPSESSYSVLSRLSLLVGLSAMVATAYAWIKRMSYANTRKSEFMRSITSNTPGRWMCEEVSQAMMRNK